MKIKKLEINSFRGVPDKLIIDFSSKNKSPTSLILLGDNGVGKSSIVDSIELCLQGQISQSTALDLKTSPSARSFYSQNLPKIRITLENDEVVNREIIYDEQGILSNVKSAHRLFSVSPFVLRRHDLLRFIDSSEAERALVFSNYLRDNNNADWVEHPIDEIKRLQDERLRLKNERDSLILALANELKISVDDIPFNRKEYNEFVKDKIYKGISKFQIETSGFKVKLNQKAIQLADDVYSAMENHRKIKSQINEFSVSAKAITFPKHLLSQLEIFLSRVSEKLTASFLEISPLQFLDRIEIKYDNQSVLALSLTLFLKNNRSCSPNQLLSEANLDLLALLFFLAFIQESAERGQSKFLILDDVLQSVDATIRVSFISYLLKNFHDWQYIITAHDRLWHRQLIELMNSHGHQHFNISIVGWSFEQGPEIRNIEGGIDDSLSVALQEKNLINICSTAGLLLEEISDVLSKTLNISIHRKRDDKYTLGDLFPGLVKQLKKSSIKAQVEQVEKWIHLRNLVGAHYNEWALALSLEEARLFGESVINLFNVVKCKNCSRWISNNPELNFYSCKCGSIMVQK